MRRRGFTQRGPAPFDDFTRCMQRDAERLVVQAQGLGPLSLFDSEADDNLMFRVCFDPSVTVEEMRSPNEK